MTDSLWPSDIATQNFVTPVSILKEQAAALGEMTRQLVIAEVRSSSSGATFNHRFTLSAPALGNYVIDLFQIQHGISFYPMRLDWKNSGYSLNSESELKNLLKQIFADSTTKNVVQSMLAQLNA